MSNFTHTNLLLHAKDLSYPPIEPLYKENSHDDFSAEEISFFQDFSEEFSELVVEPRVSVMESILLQLRPKVN